VCLLKIVHTNTKQHLTPILKQVNTSRKGLMTIVINVF